LARKQGAALLWCGDLFDFPARGPLSAGMQLHWALNFRLVDPGNRWRAAFVAGGSFRGAAQWLQPEVLAGRPALCLGTIGAGGWPVVLLCAVGAKASPGPTAPWLRHFSLFRWGGSTRIANARMVDPGFGGHSGSDRRGEHPGAQPTRHPLFLLPGPRSIHSPLEGWHGASAGWGAGFGTRLCHEMALPPLAITAPVQVAWLVALRGASLLVRSRCRAACVGTLPRFTVTGPDSGRWSVAAEAIPVSADERICCSNRAASLAILERLPGL